MYCQQMCFEITVLNSGKKKIIIWVYICTKMNSKCGNDLNIRNHKAEEKANEQTNKGD